MSQKSQTYIFMYNFLCQNDYIFTKVLKLYQVFAAKCFNIIFESIVFLFSHLLKCKNSIIPLAYCALGINY